MNNPSPKNIEDSIQVFDYQISNTIFLRKSPDNYNANFFELPFLRKSTRCLSRLKDEQLSDILWFTSKVIRANYSKGYILTHRPTPSAGAIHPIDLLISIPNQPLILYYYNPFSHTLNQLKLSEEIVKSFINHINKNLRLNDATLIWFIAHTNRTASKYENFQSLVWRDAGALLQSIQLTCTAMSLGSCPVGTLAEPFVHHLFNDTNVISAGGIIVGSI